MISSNVISLEILGKSSGTVDYYVIAPYRCTIADVRAVCHVDPGDADTVTLSFTDSSSSSITLGVATFGSSIAAGASATWVEDASSGDTVIPADRAIKVQTSALAAVGTGSTLHVDIELDPHALTADDFS